MSNNTTEQCATPICLACNMGPCHHQKTLISAEYVAGIGWMAVTATGRYGNYETEAQALRAAVAKVTGGAT